MANENQSVTYLVSCCRNDLAGTVCVTASQKQVSKPAEISFINVNDNMNKKRKYQQTER